MQKDQPHSTIAILSNPSGVSKRVLLGVASFIRKNANWSMSPYDSVSDHNLKDILENCNGAIIIDHDGTDRSKINSLAEILPVVVIGNQEGTPPFPVFKTDDKKVSLIAANTFLDRGFNRFAFAGAMAYQETRERYHFFKEILGNSKHSPVVFSSNFHLGSVESIESGEDMPTRKRLLEWVENLPKPIGVFASDDNIAFEIYQAANKSDTKIPDEIALLGVNDDGFLCRITNPSLSSIRLPYERIGFDAAKQLMVEIKSQTKRKEMVNLYEPIGLIARDSIKAVVVEDQIVRDAILYIQENYTRPINIEDVLEKLNVSRSLLERRFRDEMGITPLVELRRQRIEKARALLSDTNEPIHDMGRRCGFSSAIRFTTVFKEQVGITPSEFRKRMCPLLQG